MHRLIEGIFAPAFGMDSCAPLHDGAAFSAAGARFAFTTDSFVVKPLFFPGGSIGELAVFGTVNDLAMCGARPLYLSAGFILEEGLSTDDLRRIVALMAKAAGIAGVRIITGDTKVVEKGKGDGVYINTAGIGIVEAPEPVIPQAVQPGDAVIFSGPLAAHGVAILSVREGLQFESPVVSDAAPLWPPVEALIREGISLHCLRDMTRGGAAAALNEIASAAGVAIQLEESAIPLDEPVRGACELLGLDPLYVANEGCFVAFVPAEQAAKAIGVLRRFEVSSQAAIVGRVSSEQPPVVLLHSSIGGSRVVDLLSGEQLPRIC